MNVDLEIVIDSVDAAELSKKFEQARAAVGANLPQIGDHVVTEIRKVIQARDLWVTGNLANSIDYLVINTGGNLELLVGATVDYAAYKEFGTVAHFVPFKVALSLYNEARLKWGWKPGKQPMTLIPPGGGRPRTGIRVSGKAVPFVYPGWSASIPYIEQKVKQAIKGAVG